MKKKSEGQRGFSYTNVYTVWTAQTQPDKKELQMYFVCFNHSSKLRTISIL